MTQRTLAPKPSRAEDPRNPVTRLAALLDEGSLELITPDDDSGMLAAVGSVQGTRVVAFCSDATVMGGAMGDQGCQVLRAQAQAIAEREVPQRGARSTVGGRMGWSREQRPFGPLCVCVCV